MRDDQARRRSGRCSSRCRRWHRSRFTSYLSLLLLCVRVKPLLERKRERERARERCSRAFRHSCTFSSFEAKQVIPQWFGAPAGSRIVRDNLVVGVSRLRSSTVHPLSLCRVGGKMWRHRSTDLIGRLLAIERVGCFWCMGRSVPRTWPLCGRRLSRLTRVVCLVVSGAKGHQ